MKLKLTEAQAAALRAFLDKSEDAEQLSEREYVADLYDIERPLSLDLVFVKGGVAVDGAAELKYDEEQDGWYMGQRLDSPEAVLDALVEAGSTFRPDKKEAYRQAIGNEKSETAKKRRMLTRSVRKRY